MSPEQTTKQFVSNLANNQYKEANLNLQKMIENKLKERIKKCFEVKK